MIFQNSVGSAPSPLWAFLCLNDLKSFWISTKVLFLVSGMTKKMYVAVKEQTARNTRKQYCCSPICANHNRINTQLWGLVPKFDNQQVLIKHLKCKICSLNTYHNKREDQADEEEAQPVQWSSDHVSGRPCGLCEQLSGQNVRHATFSEDKQDKTSQLIHNSC